MAITQDDYYKAQVKEYTAVANAIRVLMGQPVFGEENSVPYEWTKDYTGNLATLKTLLERVSSIIGGSSQEEGIGNQLEDKVEDLLDRINDLLDSEENTIEGTIDEIENLFETLEEIESGDSQEPSGKSPEEIIQDIVDAKESIEGILDPTDQGEYPLNDLIDELEEQIADIRETIPDPDAEPGDPDTRTLEEVAEDIADTASRKNELEELISDIEEVIHEAAIIVGEEDPGQGESVEASKQFINDTADDIWVEMEDQGLDWEDLTDDQKLVLILDDLLDYIESLEAEVEEYRNGGFSLIQFSEYVEGSRILTEVENLERGLRATMTPAQRLQERLVIYVSKLIFNSKESFLCTGLIDGIRKDAAFMYTDSGNVNFYTTTAPSSGAKLQPGKYLIRVVLSLQEG